MSTRPILVGERLPEIGAPVLCYVPNLHRIWSEDGRDPLLVDAGDPKHLLRSEQGQWLLLARDGDGWWRCHGTQLKHSDITHWLPLPPKPE